MFTDFKNFTKLAENMTPQELVEEIHYCYSEFDKILSKHNVEKIKTIGDGYMAAGGLPIENKTNPVDTIMSALEIQRFMKTEKERRIREKKVFFELRIGINTGPVVAGIVGIKKFAYDIWGDTVNIASRIESAGEVGDVTISGTTYECVKDHFNCIYKGKTEAKNKGMIDVYVVESLKTI
jgi:class 3 adenylate cyclase